MGTNPEGASEFMKVRRYETVYIVDSNLEQDKLDAIASRVNEIIKGVDGKVVDEVNWGKKRLAYEINKRQYGNYFIINFDATGEAVDEVERYLRLNPSVLRYLTIHLDQNTLRRIRLDEQRRKREEEKALEASQMVSKNDEEKNE